MGFSTSCSDKIPKNRLREKRLQQGLTQEELAQKAGVSRQTVSGVESGQYGPSLSVAFRMAKALNTSLDDLFWFLTEEQMPEKLVVPCVGPVKKGARALVARFPQGFTAFPVSRQDFCQETNSVITEVYGQNKAEVKIFNPDMLKRKTIFLAGCSPALAVLMQTINIRYKDLFFFWATVNSVQALDALRDGFVQVAGLHFFDEQTREYNLPFIKKNLQNESYVVFSLYMGEQGLLVAKGNPKSIGGIGDLIRPDVFLVNRERGAEARRILDSGLKKRRLKPEKVRGYTFKVNTHFEIAQAVLFGAADCGIALKPVAVQYDLDFIPSTRERYDLVILKKELENPGVQALLEVINSAEVKIKLQMHGYDSEISGEERT